MIASLSQARLCIIGLGLMGGSLGAALRAQRACRAVIGSDRQAAVCQLAVALGVVDEATVDTTEVVRQADIVVLATPVRSIIRLVTDLAPHLRPDTLLMDIGSTKMAIIEAMEHLPSHVQPIGGHPMCGKERAGVEAADATLYHGATFCLTPLARTRPDALALAGELVRAVGARPLVIEPQRHDALVAVTSHLPYLVAIVLTATTGHTASSDLLTWQLAASGFRDTSRLAGSDIDMMVDILLTNRQRVAGPAREAAQRLLELATMIETDDEVALRAALTAAQSIRQQVYR